MRTRSRERGSILLALAALGCGEGKPEVAIQPAEQLPIRELTIAGVPDELEAVTLVYTPAEEEWADLYLEEQVERDEAGNFVTFVPVHPAGVAEGGTLKLEIEGVEHRPLALIVKPAPPAPGTTREYVVGAARVSRSLIESWGAPVDEVVWLLEEDPQSLPLQLLFPALAVYFLDGPERATSLVAAVDRLGTVLDGEPIDLDATDRLLALSNMPAAMQKVEAAAAELAATPIARALRQAAGAEPTAVSSLSPRTSASLANFGHESPYFSGGASTQPIIGYVRMADVLVRDLALRVTGQLGKQTLPQEEPPVWQSLWEETNEQLSAMATAMDPQLSKVSIGTAGELATYMRRHAKLVRELEGASQRNARKSSMFVMGFVPSAVTELIGLVNWWLDLSLRSNLGLLPSRLDLSADVSKTEFEEDATEKGYWKAKITGDSETFVVNWADVIGFVEKVWKYVPAKRYPQDRTDHHLNALEVWEGPARRWNQRSRAANQADLQASQARYDEFLDDAIHVLPSDRVPSLLDPIDPGSWSDLPGAEALQKTAKGMLKKLLVLKPLKKSGVLTFGPYTWGPFPLKNPKLVEAEIVAKAGLKPCARVLAEERQPYQAAAAGECMLKIKTRRDAFGGNFRWIGDPKKASKNRHMGSASADVGLLVKKIIVGVRQVQPQTQPVATGQHVLFKAEVRNAMDKHIEWRFARGELSSSDDTQLVWKAPKELRDEDTGERICRDIIAIEVESMAKTGPRKGRQPPRLGRTTITVEEPTELEIIPGDAVLLPEETLHFRYEGAEEAEVEWSADKPGEIDAKTGLFRAPKENGLYEVTAKVAGKGEEDSCAEDAVIVRVSSCSWIVTFDGTTIVSKPGDGASFTDMQSGFTLALGQNEGGMVTLIGSGAESGAVGSNMGASMYEQYTGEFPIFFDRKGGGVVAGRASGTVQVLDAMTYSERSAQLSVEFVIADDDLIDPLITSVTHLSCEVR